MKCPARDVQWEGKNITVYVRYPSQTNEMPKLIACYRQELQGSPEEFGTRYMLAACLYSVGQIQEAKTEWAWVAQHGGEEWTHTVNEAMQALSQRL